MIVLSGRGHVDRSVVGLRLWLHLCRGGFLGRWFSRTTTFEEKKDERTDDGKKQERPNDGASDQRRVVRGGGRRRDHVGGR